MSAVEVEIGEEEAEEARSSFADDDEEPRQRRRRRVDSGEIEVEREVTKRQLIQSISTVLVVVLYMVFTLLRDREAGVVVIDPDDAGDDWDED